MAIKMYRTRRVLNFREDKPTVYTLQQLTYPVIKEKDLIKYIANSANVPVATIEACVSAIAEAIVYYSINGHRVVFPEFGGFYVKVNVKARPSAAEVSAKDVKACRLAYAPATMLRELISETGTDIMNTQIYGVNVEPENVGG